MKEKWRVLADKLIRANLVRQNWGRTKEKPGQGVPLPDKRVRKRWCVLMRGKKCLWIVTLNIVVSVYLDEETTCTYVTSIAIEILSGRLCNYISSQLATRSNNNGEWMPIRCLWRRSFHSYSDNKRLFLSYCVFSCPCNKISFCLRLHLKSFLRDYRLSRIQIRRQSMNHKFHSLSTLVLLFKSFSLYDKVWKFTFPFHRNKLEVRKQLPI